LKVSGTGFVMYESTIVFAGRDEPTQLNPDGTVSTGVNMGYWHGADVIEVRVRNGTQLSEPLEFTFTAPVGGMRQETADYRSKHDDDPDRDEHDDEPAKKKKKK
jgi:hypothetical protein